MGIQVHVHLHVHVHVHVHVYYGNQVEFSWSRHHALEAPPPRLGLQLLLQLSLLGEREGVGEEEVQHPWMERLDEALRVVGDCYIVLPRFDRLVPGNVGLKNA